MRCPVMKFFNFFKQIHGTNIQDYTGKKTHR